MVGLATATCWRIAEGVSNLFSTRGRRNMPFGMLIRGVARRFMAITQPFGGWALAGFGLAKCLNEDNYFFQKLS
jgi:hypothetical protein